MSATGFYVRMSLITLATAGFIAGIVYNVVEASDREDDCRAQCYPRDIRVIGEVCHCATETGWVRE